MKQKWIFICAAIALALSACGSESTRIVGSGASFPFPLYSAWLADLNRTVTSGVRFDFQAKGSGAGIQDLINNTVDFAASDAAMTPEQITQVQQGVILLPMTAGEVVLAYNIPGIPQGLKLPREIYPEIFLGTISRWNDPRIVAANPGLDLPDLPLTVVRRSDASGTNYVFTKHLSAISERFRDQVGVGANVVWPSSDRIIAAPRNAGVAATLSQTPGTIGYVEYNFAKMSNLNIALLQNRSGNYVGPGGEGGTLALAGAEFSPELIAWVEDPADPKAYPITTFTWMLFYKKQDAKKAEYLRKMVEYGLTDGQKTAEDMGFIPLPPNVIAKVRAASALIQ